MIKKTLYTLAFLATCYMPMTHGATEYYYLGVNGELSDGKAYNCELMVPVTEGKDLEAKEINNSLKKDTPITKNIMLGYYMHSIAIGVEYEAFPSGNKKLSTAITDPKACKYSIELILSKKEDETIPLYIMEKEGPTNWIIKPYKAPGSPSAFLQDNIYWIIFGVIIVSSLVWIWMVQSEEEDLQQKNHQVRPYSGDYKTQNSYNQKQVKNNNKTALRTKFPSKAPRQKRPLAARPR